MGLDPREKVAVIAGGATGLGAAVVRRLASNGIAVIAADLNVDAAELLAAELRNDGHSVSAVEFDISVEQSVIGLFDRVASDHGGVDYLVNVAADLSANVLGRDSDLIDVPIEVWRRSIDVDLTGYFLTARSAVPHMLIRGGGRIVNISSEASVIGEAKRPSYGAAKAGVNALTRHIARRFGREGIRCNAIAPGMVPTDAAINNPAGSKPTDRAAANPSGKLGTPDEIAAPVAFLLTPESDWINGQVLHVSGGQFMGL